MDLAKNIIHLQFHVQRKYMFHRLFWIFEKGSKISYKKNLKIVYKKKVCLRRISNYFLNPWNFLSFLSIN